MSEDFKTTFLDFVEGYPCPCEITGLGLEPPVVISERRFMYNFHKNRAALNFLKSLLCFCKVKCSVHVDKASRELRLLCDHPISEPAMIKMINQLGNLMGWEQFWTVLPRIKRLPSYSSFTSRRRFLKRACRCEYTKHGVLDRATLADLTCVSRIPGYFYVGFDLCYIEQNISTGQKSIVRARDRYSVAM